MVGGSEAVFARLKPILATMGTELTLCGGVGAGQVENYHGHRRSHFVRRGCTCGRPGRCNQPAGLPWLTAFCTRAAKRKVACQGSVLALLTRALAHNPKFCGVPRLPPQADCVRQSPAFVSDGVSCVDQKRTPHNLRPIDCSGRKPQGTRHTCMAPVCD
jgi:hypothetical protein